MLDACVMTLVRNGDDYIEQVIRAVLPYVPTVRVAIDRRSTDKTWEILERLSEENAKIRVSSFSVKNPLTDLVDARNSLLGFSEKWGLIMDSDEYHHDISNYRPTYGADYRILCYAVWDDRRAHYATSRRSAERLFSNRGKLEWRGYFGQENLYRDGKPAFSQARMLTQDYIHFTHVKKDQWRNELDQKRKADDRQLFEMPENIISIVKEVNEKRPM